MCQLLQQACKQDAMNSELNLISRLEPFQFPYGRHARTELNAVM
jgi:hypothetical protein